MRIIGTESRRLATRLVLAVLVLVATGACGIPTDDQVEVLAPEGHEELLNGTTTTTEPPPELDQSETKTVVLYFVGIDNNLEVVERQLTLPINGADVLGALEEGPNPLEIETFAELGILTSLLPEGLSGTFGERNEETGVQPVNVDPEAGLRLLDDADTKRTIVSQIVCTVLNLNQPNISGVEIFDGEEAIPLNDNDAEPIQGPAEIDDFDGCKTGTERRAELASTTTTSG